MHDHHEGFEAFTEDRQPTTIGIEQPDLCKRPVPPPADPAEQAERKLYGLPMHVTPVTPRTHQTRST